MVGGEGFVMSGEKKVFFLKVDQVSIKKTTFTFVLVCTGELLTCKIIDGD